MQTKIWRTVCVCVCIEWRGVLVLELGGIVPLSESP